MLTMLSEISEIMKDFLDTDFCSCFPLTVVVLVGDIDDEEGLDIFAGKGRRHSELIQAFLFSTQKGKLL